MTNLGVFDLAAALTLPKICLSDPPDLVPAPPPPLAPPWLHHSVYRELLDSPTPSK
ncbi:hypothetical protein A2U01_0070226, partial [Trifolium medium]|nr:hypothetical protein [Trifolium medium]